MDNEFEFTLRMNAKQAHSLVKAMELFVRMGLGQLEYLGEMLLENHADAFPKEDIQTFCRLREVLEKGLQAVKLESLHYPSNASKGVTSPTTSNTSKIVYDLECVLRQQIARAEKHQTFSVWHGDPLHLGSEPLATAEFKEVWKGEPKKD